MIFLPHTNTVILLEPYCGTITEPGLPVVEEGIEKYDFREFNSRYRNFCRASNDKGGA